MKSTQNNLSIINNVGLLFLLAYSLYFFLFPIIFFILEGNEFIENLVYSLYTQKGLWFTSHKSLFYSFTGIVFFLIGYIFFLRNEVSDSNKVLLFFDKKWPFRNILLSAIILFFGGVLSKLLNVLKGAHLHGHYWSAVSENQLLNFFVFFNVLQILSLILVLYGYLTAKKECNIFWKRVFFAIFLFMFISMLLATTIHGSKALTLGIIFPVLAMYSSEFSFKKSLIMLCFMAASVIGVMSGKILIENNGINNISAQNNPLHSVVETFIGRSNQTHIITEIFARQDKVIGIKVFGEFYQHLKPPEERINIIQNGNKFAQDYGFINILDNATGVGRTVIGGLYMSFGFLGIVFGMLLLGFLYKTIFLLNRTDFGVIFYSFTLLNLLLRIEQDMLFVLMTISFHFSIVFIVYLAAMKGGIMDHFFHLLKRFIFK
jgi:hypothetical protein